MSNIHQNEYLPYGRHSITESDINEVVKTLRSKNLTQGVKVDEFEDNVARRVGSNHAVAVNSATSALHLSCLALGATYNDWVWTSPISFVASSNCALYCGSNIDFVDINPFTGLMDVKSLKNKLKIAKKQNRLPKVIIPVHLAGSSCDMEEIFSLSKIYGFSIIEDASHAIGGKYKGDFVGNCKYSSITVFSFHPVKIITTGEGGIATTNNAFLAEKIRSLRSHGIIKDSDKFNKQSKGSWYYEQQSLGFNYRITDIQASLGLSQLKRLEEIINVRNRQLNFYREILDELPLSILEIPENVNSAVHLAVIKLRKISSKYYSKIFEGLRAQQIGVQLHYRPIYKNPFYEKYNFDKSHFPGAEEYESSAISIPLYPGLTRSEQLRVKNAIDILLK